MNLFVSLTSQDQAFTSPYSFMCVLAVKLWTWMSGSKLDALPSQPILTAMFIA